MKYSRNSLQKDPENSSPLSLALVFNQSRGWEWNQDQVAGNVCYFFSFVEAGNYVGQLKKNNLYFGNMWIIEFTERSLNKGGYPIATRVEKLGEEFNRGWWFWGSGLGTLNSFFLISLKWTSHHLSICQFNSLLCFTLP